MDSTLGGQTKHKTSKVYSVLCVSYNVKFTTSEVMQTSDGPTNPRTRRVIKNRQVNSGSFTLHTVSPMQLHIHFCRKFSELLHFLILLN